MVKLLKPTRATTFAFLVLFLGTILIPSIVNFLQNYYIAVTSTTEQLTQTLHQRPTPVMFFAIYPLLYDIWLYILGCSIVYIAKKKRK